MMEIVTWFDSSTLIVAGIATLLFILYMFSANSQLRKSNIPGPFPLPIIGNALPWLTMGGDKMEAYYLQRYGKVFRWYLGKSGAVTVADIDVLKNIFIKDFSNFPNRTSAISHPKLVQQGLFFMTDDEWKRTRNIMTPAFSSGKLKRMCGEIVRCAGTLVKNLEDHANTGSSILIKKYFGSFTMDAIATTAFGLQIDSQKDPEDPFVKHASAIFIDSGGDRSLAFRLAVLMSVIFPSLAKLIQGGRSLWPPSTIDFFTRTGEQLIEERKKNQLGRVDFMQLLLNAELDESIQDDTAALPSANVASDSGTERKESSRKLTVDEINAQTFLFFIAAYETTASLLRWASYVLAVHPEFDHQLYQEILDNIEEGEELNYENITRLKYLDQFLHETLRFYPPLSRLNRQAVDDVTYNGMNFPKGTRVFIPVYNIHHDPDVYQDPEAFSPERFSTENKASMHPAAFLSFGVGPRHCIGMRLALLEAKIALVVVLRKLKFVETSDTQVPVPLKLQGFTAPVTPIQIGIKTR